MTDILTENRPCYVNGERAVFHGWIKNQTVLLNCSRLLTPNVIREKLKLLKEYEYIDGDCEPVIIEATFALIEYADGRVSKVNPEAVRFIKE